MELIHLNTETLDELISHGASDAEKYRWIALSGSRQLKACAAPLEVLRRDTVVWQAFSVKRTGRAIGIAAFDEVDHDLLAATLCGVLVDPRYAAPRYLSQAALHMLDWGFNELHLEVVNAWSVESNTKWLKLLGRLNFRSVGRERKSYRADGSVHDRLWFELLKAEHERLNKSS